MSDYCEMPEWFSERVSKSRKDYKCCECGGRIPKGMKYWNCSGKWGGRVSQYRQHIECRDACYSFQEYDGYGECIGFGELREEMGNRWDWQRWEYANRDPDDETMRMRDREEHEALCRKLLAAGLRASRLKPDQVEAYNLKHKDRMA